MKSSNILKVFIPKKPGDIREELRDQLHDTLHLSKKKTCDFCSKKHNKSTMVSDRKKKKGGSSAAISDLAAYMEPKLEESSPKKSKKSASPKKAAKAPAKKKVKRENGEEPLADEPFWPEPDLLELIRKVETTIPPKDQLRYDSRVERLNWEGVAFGDYSAAQCKQMWMLIQKRLRRFRLLKEIVVDAKAWVSQPWTNFYRSHKQNRHPDQPRRPLSTYMIFYLEKKDKVAKENPDLEMTEISKKIAFMYKNLTDKQKQKFVQKAAQQRQEYETKLEAFYKLHPELIPKASKREKPAGQTYPGPKKPCTPFQLFFAEKLEKHKNDPNANRTSLLEHYREQWKELSEKKKLSWIFAALEDETRYQDELKAYQEENPDFVPLSLKATLTRDEKQLQERSAGKPEKPPNSGYSLFSRMMLTSEEIKKVDSKQRMAQISQMWKILSVGNKRKYHDKVQQMLEQYKLDFATYLESLTPEKREEELKASQRRKRPAVPRKKKIKAEEVDEEESSQDEDDDPETSPSPPPAKIKKENNSNSEATSSKIKKEKAKPANNHQLKLFKGEPEPPPVMAYKLFLKEFMASATHTAEKDRMKEAPRYWQLLSELEKTKYRKRLVDLKQKYIANYEKFLKSLSQEELKEYSLLKAKSKQSEEESHEDDSDASEQESGSDNEGQQSDEVRVAGVVRTASFPPLPRRSSSLPKKHKLTDLEDSSAASSSGSASDSESSASESESDSE